MAEPDVPRVLGLSHLTLAVTDVDRSVRFYRDLLGFALRAQWLDGAYLEAGPLWLCVSRDHHARTSPHPDYTHVAFTVDAEHFAVLATQVAAVASTWKDNRSEGASLYFLDPDGHKLELHVGTLGSRLADYRSRPNTDVIVFDP